MGSITQSSQGKVYGSIFSTCTKNVLTVAAESSIDVELVDIHFEKGGHKQPDHKARQPFGKIPAYEGADGFKLFESRSIGRYLSELGNKSLYPADIKQRAIVDQWMSVEQSTVNPLLSAILVERVWGPTFYGKTTDENKVAESAKTLGNALDVLDAHLSTTEYMANNKFSLADLYYLSYLQLLTSTPEWSVVKQRKNVLAWWNRISQRPSWQKVVTQDPSYKPVDTTSA